MSYFKVQKIKIPQKGEGKTYEDGRITFEFKADIGGGRSYSGLLDLVKLDTGKWFASMNVDEMPKDIHTPEAALAKLGQYFRGLSELLHEETLKDFPIAHLFNDHRVESFSSIQDKAMIAAEQCGAIDAEDHDEAIDVVDHDEAIDTVTTSSKDGYEE